MALINNPVPETTMPETSGSAACTRIAEDGYAAPSRSTVVIRPGGSSLPVYLREIWDYRELLYFLAWREVKVRYKQTALGIAWAWLQPLFAMLVFTVFFGRLAHVSSDGFPYEVFVFVALVPWTYFSNSISLSANSVVSHSNLVTKVYFPRLIVPMSSVIAGWVDIAISLLLLLPLTFLYKIDWTWRMATLPALILLLSLLAIAVGAWMAALNVKYRDVRHALPFFIQAWMFFTPIIYPSSLVPQEWRWLFRMNPLTGVLEAFRSAILGRQFDLTSLAISIGLTVLLLCYSLISFRSMERRFADVV
ncbi:MAG: type transporter [Candidatus Angelobacter sp.]|nr:type transporter [Candidatus Angelobacter sp.]